MKDFEKKFQKSVLALVIFHVLVTFIAIFLVQSHIPRTRGNLERSFELRASIDFLLRCATPVSGIVDKSCAENWRKTVERLEALAGEHEIDLETVKALASLAYPGFIQDELARSSGQRNLLDLASGYDREWARKGIGFQTAVASSGWILGVLSIGFLIYINYFYKTLHKTMILPILELNQTLAEWKAGNRLRRCQLQTEGKDLQILMDNVNEFLDERLLPQKK